jgi:hypothetical protein
MPRHGQSAGGRQTQVWGRVLGLNTLPIATHSKRKGLDMDNVTLIRIISGVLFVIVLGILIQRRRTSVK